MLVSNAPTSPTTIPLSGTGSAQVLQLTPSTTSLASAIKLSTPAPTECNAHEYGQRRREHFASQCRGSGFTLNGSAPLVTLPAGQAASFSVTFTPAVAGSATERIGGQHGREFAALDFTQRWEFNRRFP